MITDRQSDLDPRDDFWSSPQPAWCWTTFLSAIPYAYWVKSQTTPNLALMDVPKGRVVCRTSGMNGSIAGLSWTSPFDGWIEIRGGVWIAQPNGGAARVRMYQNNPSNPITDIARLESGQYDSGLPLNLRYGSGGDLALRRPVTTGDVIFFEVQQTSEDWRPPHVGVDLSIVRIADSRPGDAWLSKDFAEDMFLGNLGMVLDPKGAQPRVGLLVGDFERLGVLRVIERPTLAADGLPNTELQIILFDEFGFIKTVKENTCRLLPCWQEREAIFKHAVDAGSVGNVLHVTTPVLPDGKKGEALSAKLAAANGTAPYQWSVFPGGGTPPPGLTLLPDGRISGTPSALGKYLFTVQVQDVAGMQATADFTISVSSDEGCQGLVKIQRIDLNGDGNGDIADAIFILQYLFMGGPGPNPLEVFVQQH